MLVRPLRRTARTLLAPIVVLGVAVVAVLPTPGATHPSAGPSPERFDARLLPASSSAWLESTYTSGSEVRTISAAESYPGHDPDVEARIDEDDLPAARRVSPEQVSCAGDGTDGPRIRLWYGHIAGEDNRVEELRDTLTSLAARADLMLGEGAAMVGATRHLRWQTTQPVDRFCEPIIRVIELPDGAQTDFNVTIRQLVESDNIATDQREVVMLDTGDADPGRICGIAMSPIDDRPGAVNDVENFGAVAQVNSQCWNASTLLHEIFHTLGAVQPTAPTFDGAGHIAHVADGDVMVPIATFGPQFGLGGPIDTDCDQTLRFFSRVNLDRLECETGHYFNPEPAPGTYLAERWNSATSHFLHAFPQPAPHTGRIAGPDRVATALLTSQSDIEDGAADAVVLARLDDFADALAGTPLAVAADGPLLLTTSDSLLPVVADEIERVLDGDGDVYLLGGTAALGDDVAEAVEDLGANPIRLSGEGRFETAAEIAAAVVDVRGGVAPGDADDEDDDLGLSRVFVATGSDFADGLVAGSVAARTNGIVLLSAGDDLTDETADLIEAYLDADIEIVAVGGDAAAAVPDAEAIVGDGRFETAQLLAEAFPTEAAPTEIALASGLTFPDALAGGAHAARNNLPLLLSDGSRLSPEVRRFSYFVPADVDDPSFADVILRDVEDPVVGRVTMYGGAGALSEAVQTSASYMVRKLPPRVPSELR